MQIGGENGLLLALLFSLSQLGGTNLITKHTSPANDAYY